MIKLQQIRSGKWAPHLSKLFYQSEWDTSNLEVIGEHDAFKTENLTVEVLNKAVNKLQWIQKYHSCRSRKCFKFVNLSVTDVIEQTESDSVSHHNSDITVKKMECV